MPSTRLPETSPPPSAATGAKGDAANPPPPPPRPARRRASLTARGEPMVWLTGGTVALAVLMIVLLLGYIILQGVVTFWPGPLTMLKTRDGRAILGEPSRQQTYVPAGATEPIGRTLYRTGNFDLAGTRFTWVDDANIVEKTAP